MRTNQSSILLSLTLLVFVGCSSDHHLPTSVSISNKVDAVNPPATLTRGQLPSLRRKIVDEGMQLVSAMVSGEQVHYQETVEYLDIANNEEAHVKLGIEFGKTGRRWDTSVRDASAEGFVATGIGREHTAAHGWRITARFSRRRPIEWIVERLDKKRP